MTMNHLGKIAWVTSLSAAAAFSPSFLGCGGSSNDTTSTGAAGTIDTASGGAAGTNGDTATAGSGGGTSTGTGGAAGNGTGGATSLADASNPDASVDANRPDASGDGGPHDAAVDALGERDASMNIDASTIDVVSSEGGVESGSPDTGGDAGGSDGCDVDTLACVKTRDKPGSSPETKCSQCMTDNGCFDVNQMGGSCEDTAGTADAACATAVGSSSSLTETQLCLHTLQAIFSSQCAATEQLTPCLCGSTDAGECLAGNVTPNGPLYDIYKCQLGTTGPQIASTFTIQTFGTGQANALAQCAGSFGCDCF